MVMKFNDLFHRIKAAKEEGTAHPVKSGRYELWSHDTFEGRTYLCRVYYSYEEAMAELKRCEKEALSQPKELRDTYWIAGPEDQ